MLKTKTVKYLQSRPHHIKVMIFVFTMVTTGVLGLSFLASSLSNNFIAADIKKNNEENGTVEIAEVDDVKSSSLLEGLKANIYDLSGSIGSIFSGDDDDENLSIKENDIIEKEYPMKDAIEGHIEYKEIKPAQLPVEQQ